MAAASALAVNQKPQRRRFSAWNYVKNNMPFLDLFPLRPVLLVQLFVNFSWQERFAFARL
jgi:hypothetical protein